MCEVWVNFVVEFDRSGEKYLILAFPIMRILAWNDRLYKKSARFKSLFRNLDELTDKSLWIKSGEQ